MNKSLWKAYINGDIPHIHISSDIFQNTFEDALCIQAKRILGNLQKAIPDKSKEELIELMFYGEET